FFQFNIRGFFSFVVILLGWSFFRDTFQFNFSSKEEKPEFSICSYNAGLFGYFQAKWRSAETINALEKHKSDVVCIQEFLNLGEDGETTLDTIRKACDYPFVVFEKLKDGRKRGAYGMAILSKYPLKDPELVHFDGITGNMCLSVQVHKDTQIFKVYSVHLQSLRFSKADYKFISEFSSTKTDKFSSSKGILTRMKSAYMKRAEQVEKIREHIVQSEYPVFLTGDFNDPPVSFSYRKLGHGLKDAFIGNGNGMGKTYIGLMPNFTIDYIFSPSEMQAISFNSERLGSDHSMIRAGFKVNSK